MYRAAVLVFATSLCAGCSSSPGDPPASCEDGAQNGSESAVDCGGADCEPCGSALACVVARDCASGICVNDACVAPACDDAVRNGDESAVDCGGSCSPCARGAACVRGEDCLSGACDGVCQAPSCTDLVRNGGESSVDCGGPCAPCADGLACVRAEDCVSAVCVDSVCLAHTCADEARNADETDVDCGGSCGPCADGLGCAVRADCLSQVCDGTTCAAPTCADGVQNGEESDVDCSGACDRCADGRSCEVPADCASRVCMAGSCLAATCADSTQNADETDADCGGRCAPCADGLGCRGPADCQSSVCTNDVCAEPSCADRTRNGTESDVDCGGEDCAACPSGARCDGPTDCVSLVCTAGACQAPTCTDLALNADETDVDCGGGTCPACADGLACAGPTDCESLVCTGAVCIEATCTDQVQNADESDVDCGGRCDGCESGGACGRLADCVADIDACVNGVCAYGPTAGLAADPTFGIMPLTVTVQDQSTPGDTAIASAMYDFGAGDGFEGGPTYTYTSSGTFTITQRVTDTNGLVDDATVVATVTPAFECGFSTTDISASSVVVLTPDRQAGDWLSLASGGIRSECRVEPGSGVFYVELSRAPIHCDPTQAPASCIPAFPGTTEVGIGTRNVSLNASISGTSEGFGVATTGNYASGGTFLGNFEPSTEHYGFVVDYRGTSPIIHLVGVELFGGPAVLHSVTMSSVTAPVYAMMTSQGRLPTPELSANFGNDLTNRPFHYDPIALLRADGFNSEANALVLGFGGSTRGTANAVPSLAVSADQTVAKGSRVTVTGTATDAEDGNLTNAILWEDLSTRIAARDSGTGPSFTFTATTIGVHPIRATVVDSDGGRRQAQVTVTVTGAVLRRRPVRLDPAMPGTGAGIDLDAAGLRARWVAPDKMGVRANQGMIGSFQYFEARRLGPPTNHGAGLVVAEGDLDPYRVEDSPPSMSINFLGDGVFHNILYLDSYGPPLTARDSVGFAVDYRGLNPIVYVIAGNNVVHAYEMFDVFVPVYPMVYGNPASTPPGSYDVEVRFTAPFVQTATAALTSYGLPMVDVAALQLGWGG